MAHSLYKLNAGINTAPLKLRVMILTEIKKADFFEKSDFYSTRTQ
jgi:hypothetical protein